MRTRCQKTKMLVCADFREFAESDPTTAELLCRKIGRDFEYSLNDAMVNDGRKWDIWNRQGMFVYPALKDFALGLIQNSPYYQGILECPHSSREPNLLEFIDLEDYGRSAINLAGKNYVVQSSNGKVVETEYGW